MKTAPGLLSHCPTPKGVVTWDTGMSHGTEPMGHGGTDGTGARP